MFAYCSKGDWKCKEIDVTTFKMNFEMLLQDKMLLRIKIDGFQEQFSLVDDKSNQYLVRPPPP